SERSADYTQVSLDEVSLGVWETPAPHSTTPHRLDANRSQTITIHGDNFTAGLQATLGGYPMTDLVWIDEHSFQAGTPAVSPGRYSLVVTNPDGKSSALPTGVVAGYLFSLPYLGR